MFKKLFHIVFCFIALQAHSQSDTTHLPGAEVTTQLLPVGGSSTTPIQQLGREQLQQLNSTSVGDAVKYFSGILVKDYGGVGGLKTVSVRSLGANFTGVLYDGILINEAQGGQIDIGKFSLDNVGEISMYIPQPTAILQTARAFSSGSVLALKSLAPTFKEKEKIKYKAGFKTGSFGFVNPSASISIKLNSKFISSISAENQRADNNYLFTVFNGDSTKKQKRKNNDLKSWRVEWDNYYKFSDSNFIKAKVYYYYSNRGLPGYVVLYNDATGKQRLWDKNLFAQATWENHFGKNHLLVSGKYNYGYNRYLDTPYLSAAGKVETIFKQQEYYASAAYARDVFSFLKISAATDYFYTKLDAQVQGFIYPKRNTVLNNIAAQAKWKQVELQANVLHTYLEDAVKLGIQANSLTKFTPAFSVSYQPLSTLPLRVRAFYKAVYRVPTFNELYYTYVGNTNLHPEYAKQYNIGATWQQNTKSFIRAFAFSADAYYNNVSDKIVAVPRQNLFTWTMLNVGKVAIKGVDVNAQMWLKKLGAFEVGLRGTYTFQQALDVTNKTSDLYKSQIAYTPEHSGSGNLNINYKKLAFAYNLLWSGYRYRLGVNNRDNLVKEFQTHDISVICNFIINLKSSLKLSGELNNIYNKQYDVIQYYPMPGRSFRLGIIYSN